MSMNNNGYQSNWVGAIPQPQPPQPQPQPQNMQWGNQWYGQPPQQNTPPDNPFLVIPVQNDAVVDNYIIPKGYTAFFINYSNGVFWKRRLNDDGLTYDTVKHYFFTEEQFKQLQNQNAPCTNDEVAKLREDFDKLRKEFDDFIK